MESSAPLFLLFLGGFCPPYFTLGGLLIGLQLYTPRIVMESSAPLFLLFGGVLPTLFYFGGGAGQP